MLDPIKYKSQKANPQLNSFLETRETATKLEPYNNHTTVLFVSYMSWLSPRSPLANCASFARGPNRDANMESNAFVASRATTTDAEAVDISLANHTSQKGEEQLRAARWESHSLRSALRNARISEKLSQPESMRPSCSPCMLAKWVARATATHGVNSQDCMCNATRSVECGAATKDLV